MDIQKLKYDLAMQCALVDVLKEQSTSGKSTTYDMRVSMLEHFESYYEFYQALDKSRFEYLKKLFENLK